MGGDMVRPSEEAIGATIGMLASKGATEIAVANHDDYIKASVPMAQLEALTGGGVSRQGSNNGKLSPSFPASVPYALAVGSTFFESGLSGESKQPLSSVLVAVSHMITRSHPIRQMS